MQLQRAMATAKQQKSHGADIPILIIRRPIVARCRSDSNPQRFSFAEG